MARRRLAFPAGRHDQILPSWRDFRNHVDHREFPHVVEHARQSRWCFGYDWPAVRVEEIIDVHRISISGEVFDIALEQIAQGSDGADLTMTLHYGGSLWVPILDRLLSDEIERSRSRLLEVLAAG